MARLFPPWSNAVVRVVAVAGAAALVGVPATLMALARTPYVTGQNEPLVQPVMFDHRHHTRDDGIDCLYCHAGAETSRYAGVPPTELCLGCHAQIWPDSPLLEPVRQSYATGTPIAWRRQHDLPGFAFFHHGVHVQKGVGCVSCHGRVDRMAQVAPVARLQMQWCLDCHRAPEAHLRPVETVTDMQWQPDVPQARLGADLRRQNHVDPPTDCTGCHY